jgi:hypothetical protein
MISFDEFEAQMSEGLTPVIKGGGNTKNSVVVVPSHPENVGFVTVIVFRCPDKVEV